MSRDPTFTLTMRRAGALALNKTFALSILFWKTRSGKMPTKEWFWVYLSSKLRLYSTAFRMQKPKCLNSLC
jgi:hypothetical protein